MQAVEAGAADSPLKHAPHTAQDLTGDWPHGYSRQQAVYPQTDLVANKFWPPVSRIDNVHGDRNLICACPSPDEWMDALSQA